MFYVDFDVLVRTTILGQLNPAGRGRGEHIFYRCFMADLERKICITGVPFGRTELSIRASCRILFRSFIEGRSSGPWDSRDSREV